MKRWTGFVVCSFLLLVQCWLSFADYGLDSECLKSEPLFGQNCSFICKCKHWNECNKRTGDCAGPCANGFGGQACQYVNVTSEVDSFTISDGTGTINQLFDGKNDTCILQDGNVDGPLSVTLGNDGSWAVSVNVILGPDASNSEMLPSVDDLEVRISTNETTSVLQPSPTESYNPHVVFPLPQPAFVLNVQIQAVGNKSLALCELYVLGGQNLATNKDTILVNTANLYDTTSSDILVDGVYSGTKFELGQNHLWSITLGKNLYIWRIRIYYNQTNGHDDLLGLHVNVTMRNNSEVEVYMHGKARSHVTNPFDINLPQLIPTTEITLWHEEEGQQLELYEVEVYGDCADGYYGWQCNQKCQCQGRKDEVCDKIGGTCPRSGCRTGYSGKDCQKCPSGKFGLHCADNCSSTCIDNTCNHETGDCTIGCSSGWTGPKCMMQQSSYIPDNFTTSTDSIATNAVPEADSTVATGTADDHEIGITTTSITGYLGYHTGDSFTFGTGVTDMSKGLTGGSDTTIGIADFTTLPAKSTTSSTTPATSAATSLLTTPAKSTTSSTTPATSAATSLLTSPAKFTTSKAPAASTTSPPTPAVRTRKPVPNHNRENEDDDVSDDQDDTEEDSDDGAAAAIIVTILLLLIAACAIVVIALRRRRKLEISNQSNRDPEAQRPPRQDAPFSHDHYVVPPAISIEMDDSAAKGDGEQNNEVSHPAHEGQESCQPKNQEAQQEHNATSTPNKETETQDPDSDDEENEDDSDGEEEEEDASSEEEEEAKASKEEDKAGGNPDGEAAAEGKETAANGNEDEADGKEAAADGKEDEADGKEAETDGKEAAADGKEDGTSGEG